MAASATLFAQPPLHLQGLLPLTLDHRPYQSPVKSQASRGTCTAFSVAAMMETLDGVPADLSEQGAYGFLKLQELGKGDVGAGGLLANYPDLLGRAGFMHESVAPYDPKSGLWSKDDDARSINAIRRLLVTGHKAVTVVGYTTNGFIIKNSWGRDWGMQG